MAITTSGAFGLTIRDQFDATQLGVNWESNTIKGALFTNAITPNYDTDTAFGAGNFSSGEASGTGYTTGGNTLTSKTLAVSSGVLVWDAADMQWTTVTVSNVQGLLIYDDTLAGNNAIFCISFGGTPLSITAGTFNVVFDGSGISRWDY